jgi:phosphatidylglycerophosphate synthase
MSPADPPSASYRPTSRRPIADAFRATAHLAARLCVRAGIHPDAVSYASVGAAALAGLCFSNALRHPALLLVGPLFCYIRLWMNMLDGMVALASGKASLRGELLNDLPDRVSDVLVFAGIAHSGYGGPFLAYWAAIGALFTAYVGTFGQAVAGRREYGGVMSKPWRMVMVHLGAWTTWACLRWGSGSVLGGLQVLEWTCILVLAGCLQTLWVRLAATLRLLAGRAGTAR